MNICKSGILEGETTESKLEISRRDDREDWNKKENFLNESDRQFENERQVQAERE